MSISGENGAVKDHGNYVKSPSFHPTKRQKQTNLNDLKEVDLAPNCSNRRDPWKITWNRRPSFSVHWKMCVHIYYCDDAVRVYFEPSIQSLKVRENLDHLKVNKEKEIKGREILFYIIFSSYSFTNHLICKMLTSCNRELHILPILVYIAPFKNSIAVKPLNFIIHGAPQTVIRSTILQ